MLLKNFIKFFWKHLYWSLFNKVSDLRPTTLLKKRLQERCFQVNFVKLLGTTFLWNTFQQQLLLVIHLTVSFCKEVLYIISNLLLLEKSTKTHNSAVFSFCKYLLYFILWMCFIDKNINTRNHISLMNYLQMQSKDFGKNINKKRIKKKNENVANWKLRKVGNLRSLEKSIQSFVISEFLIWPFSQNQELGFKIFRKKILRFLKFLRFGPSL